MNRVPDESPLSRLMLRPVLLLLALAQLVVLAAPGMDRAQDRDSGAHVEIEGTRLHYVHDDAACPACQAQQLIGRVMPTTRVVVVEILTPLVRPTGSRSPSASRGHHPAAPRAPPTNRIV